ncbi:hypothetical protein H6G33_28340 [Calothrix sp. FACHB-1219]|uniref:hypothetical protein n=1 Tax=unclassified Calothrix TaxID=2619626 RepID=UPI00168793FB|nr:MULTISPECIES: hypothetical protein [unclassified Calothrix]MBD2206119.1 hypothetical protein [Calothrix sp. FACHB-168]MBD2220889.1 hypothetical protein [Calothrix sp. FACHB-1219]
MVMQPLQPVSAADLQAFLDTPEQLLQQPTELQLAFANYIETPRSLLEVLVNSTDKQVSQAASLHVNYAGEITENWQKAVDTILQQQELGQNDRLAVELLKLGTVPPCFFSEWVPAEKLIPALRNPHIPLKYRLQLLERLAQEPTLEPRLQVAESPETPLAVLEQLAGDLELPIRLAVKFNPSCPPSLIELVEGQYTVASDWNTDAEQLAMLAQSRWAWIRLAVAQNPCATAETFMQLAGDRVYKIQLAVAKNPETPADVLAVLAQHQDKTIQATVAEHLNATEEILHQLFPTQQQLLKRRENLPTSILERFFNEAATDKPIWKNSELRYLYLNQPNTPTWILAELANVDLEVLRAEILTRSNSSPIIKTLETWIQDQTIFLANVAKHPQVSGEILQHLAQYPNPYIHLAVAQNSQTPEALRDMLLQQLAVGSNLNIRLQLGSNPQTPVAILEQLGGASSSLNIMIEMLQQIAPDATPSLLNRIKEFIDNRQSPELIIFWLQQGEEFRNSILKEWDNLVESLNESERQTLAYLASQKSSIKWEGRFTAERRDRSGKKSVPSDSQAAENYQMLDGILHLLNSSYNSDRSNLEVVAALLGNPSTPATLRERLWQQSQKSPDELGRYLKDAKLRMALALNPTVLEAERNEYLQQLMATSNNFREQLARHLATPEYLLRRIADERKEYLWRTLAENPNTPADLLLRFLNEKVEKTVYSSTTMFDLVIAHPNLPVLERYRLLLEKAKAEEITKAHQLMARRADSPYALAQILEKGDRNSKLTAARSNQTPIPVLQQLAKDADEAIRQAVSKNANLPLNKLLEFTKDPSFHVRSNLAYKPLHSKIPTPIQLLEILAQDESPIIRAKVAEHPDTPVEILVQLANDTSREVKTKLIANPNTPVTILTRLGLEENLVNQRNPNTPGIVLAQAVKSMSGKNLADFIKHPVKGSQMPAETLAQLATHTDSSVRYRVASHPNTPATVLRQLARDSYVATVRAVASNPNTFPETLEVLASHPDFTTRLDVARNPNTPPRALSQIVQSTQNSGNTPNQTVDMLKSAFPGNHNDVLRCIAGNPRTPIEALEILARREFLGATPDPQAFFPPTTNDEIVRSLAYNPSLTPQLLAILTQDPSVEVRVCLVRHPNLTEALWLCLSEDTAISVREAVAAANNAPVNVLELLARDEQSEVKIKVATNSNTPIPVLELLASDENPSVRTAAASNPRLSETILAQLATDEKVEVRRAVAQNPHTPAAIKQTLRDLVFQPSKQTISPTLRGLSRIYNPSSDDITSILAEYATSENAFVRLVTLLHPQTPAELLTQAAQSEYWLERYAVADNPATPEELRQQLTHDSNRIVKAVAIANL